MTNQMKFRILKLRKQLQDQDIDAFLVLFQENRQYLSGFRGEDGQFEESAGALIISHDRLLLATDSRYELQAKNEAPLYELVCYKKGLAVELPLILHQLKSKRLGFESRRLPYDQFLKIKKEIEAQKAKLEFIPCPDKVESLRVIKDASEIQSIRQAIKLAETAFEKSIQILQPGVTELEMAWELEKNMRLSGAQSLSFPAISAFDKNSALPHAMPGKTKLKKNKPILIDWGAKLNGYCSDATRTFVLGKPEAQFQKIFTIVSDAQKKAIDAIRPGVRTKKIDDIARNHIEKKGFKDYFGHGLGHGVGLAVHESPSISPLVERDIEIKKNMVFTIEPGIYLPNWGGVRLENMVLVTKDGVEVLNRLKTTMHM